MPNDPDNATEPEAPTPQEDGYQPGHTGNLQEAVLVSDTEEAGGKEAKRGGIAEERGECEGERGRTDVTNRSPDPDAIPKHC